MCHKPWCTHIPSSSHETESGLSNAGRVPGSASPPGTRTEPRMDLEGPTGQDCLGGGGDCHVLPSCPLHLATLAHWVLLGRVWPGTQRHGRVGSTAKRSANAHELSQETVTFMAPQMPPTVFVMKTPPPHDGGQRDGVLMRQVGGDMRTQQQEGQRRFISFSNSRTRGGTFSRRPDWAFHPVPPHSAPPGATPTARLTPWETTAAFCTPI